MSWRAAAATALLVLAVGGTAHASIPDGSGLITSCYTTDPAAFGALRVIDVGAAMTCHGGENQLTFNQQALRVLRAPRALKVPRDRRDRRVLAAPASSTSVTHGTTRTPRTVAASITSASTPKRPW